MVGCKEDFGSGNGHGESANHDHPWDEGHGHGGDMPDCRDLPHADTVQIYWDGEATSLVIGGSEVRIPGIRVKMKYGADGMAVVMLAAKFRADHVEFGGASGS